MDDRNLYSKHDQVKWKTYTSTMGSGKSNVKMINSEDLIMKSSIQISPTYYPIDPHAVGHTLLYSSVSIAFPPFSSIILQVINLHWSSGIPKPRWHRRVSPYFGSPSYIPGSFELNESVAELRSDWSSHFGLWLAGKFSINEIQLNYVKL